MFSLPCRRDIDVDRVCANPSLCLSSWRQERVRVAHREGEALMSSCVRCRCGHAVAGERAGRVSPHMCVCVCVCVCLCAFCFPAVLSLLLL